MKFVTVVLAIVAIVASVHAEGFAPPKEEDIVIQQSTTETIFEINQIYMQKHNSNKDEARYRGINALHADSPIRNSRTETNQEQQPAESNPAFT
ncbi:hypothetical protein BDQ17DRAFT_1426129 [Cyathus striatus]|nr:hypothetical protein BDQ17DRAFT_1426129 [Cyathus striatus]